MAAARRNTSQRLTLVILVLLSVTFITLQYKGDANRTIVHVRNAVRDGLSPVQRVLADVFHPVGDFFSGSVNYGHVTADNAELRREISSLRRQVLENQNAEQQLQALLSEEHLPYVQNLPQLLAEVIGGATSNYTNTFEIDRGTSNGVGIGMPVVAGAGLVGVVTSAGTSTSIVSEITAPGSAFGVRIGQPGVDVVAQGQGIGYGLSLSDLSPKADIHKGEAVFTSGVMGDSMPGGIPVGKISALGPTNGVLSRNATVEPLANLSSLDFVTVLQWFPPP